VRRICVVTGSRADYGHLYWLLREIADDPELTLQLVATGSHLSPVHGHTVDRIEADGFPIAARVEMLVAGDTGTAVAKSLGLGVMGLAEAFDRLDPHVIVLLGDRFETLAAASAALMLRRPIAHLHGGEATGGLTDEAIRHGITKMAHLHFAAAEAYARRIAQMGEDPVHIYDHGAPGLDHVTRTPLPDREEIERRLSFTLAAPTFLVTYHPVTLDPAATGREIEALLGALDRFPDARMVFTGVNPDQEHSVVARQLTAFVDRRPDRAIARASLGQVLYLGLMRVADVVVGNSSSGVIEAPAMGVPTVNVGDRQSGRLRAASVIDCPGTTESIEAAIKRALDPAFRGKAEAGESPYGRGNASRRIKDTLKAVPLDGILMKTFQDLGRDG